MSARRRSTHRIHSLIYLLCLTWPWAVYERAPVVWVPLSAMAAAGLALVFLRDAWRGERLHLPYELTWPVLLLALLDGAGRLAHLPMVSPPASPLWIHAVLFVLLLHHVRGQRLAIRALSVSVASMGTVAVFQWPGRGVGLFPTALGAEGILYAYGPASLSHALASLALGIPLGFALAGASRLPGWARAGLAAAGAAMFAVLIHRAWPVLSASETGVIQPPWGEESAFPGWPIVLLLLWTWARVVAKLVVSRIEDFAGIQPGIIAALTAGLSAVVLLGAPPFGGFTILLALAAAYGTPRPRATMPAPVRWWLPLPLAGLVLFNATIVLPIHGQDPRQYDAAARRLESAEAWRDLAQYLEAVRVHLPNEARLHYWFARLALNRREPGEAADAYEAMLHGKTRVLPAPTGADRTALAEALRDLCSALPPSLRGLAYEKVLLAEGHTRSALASLELRPPVPGVKPLPASSNTPLVRVLVQLLEAPELAPSLMEWSTPVLAAVFQGLGAQIETAPAGFPARFLPAVLMARYDGGRLNIEVYAGNSSWGGSRDPLRGYAWDERGGAGSEPALVRWGPLVRGGAGWFCSLGPSDEVWFEAAPRVTLGALPVFVPSHPHGAMRVWLPPE